MDRGVLSALNVVKRSLTFCGGSLWLVSCVLNPQGEDPGFEDDSTPTFGAGDVQSVSPMTGAPSETSGVPMMCAPLADIPGMPGVAPGSEPISELPETEPPSPVVVPPAAGPADPSAPTGTSVPGITEPAGAGGGGPAGGGASAQGGNAASAGGAGGVDNTDDFDAGPFNYASDDDAGAPDGGATDAGATPADGGVDQ
jgi:hypothetical protein